MTHKYKSNKYFNAMRRDDPVPEIMNRRKHSFHDERSRDDGYPSRRRTRRGRRRPRSRSREYSRIIRSSSRDDSQHKRIRDEMYELARNSISTDRRDNEESLISNCREFREITPPQYVREHQPFASNYHEIDRDSPARYNSRERPIFSPDLRRFETNSSPPLMFQHEPRQSFSPDPRAYRENSPIRFRDDRQSFSPQGREFERRISPPIDRREYFASYDEMAENNSALFTRDRPTCSPIYREFEGNSPMRIDEMMRGDNHQLFSMNYDEQSLLQPNPSEMQTSFSPNFGNFEVTIPFDDMRMSNPHPSFAPHVGEFEGNVPAMQCNYQAMNQQAPEYLPNYQQMDVNNGASLNRPDMNSGRRRMLDNPQPFEHTPEKLGRRVKLGQPGAIDDPLRKGMSGFCTKWYLRYLRKGFTPINAKIKAEEHKFQPIGANNTPAESLTANKAPAEATVQKATKFIRLAVLPKDYPYRLFSANELKSLEEAIVAEVARGWDTKIIFGGIRFKNGYLEVDCETDRTASWLTIVGPNMSTWKGIDLTVCLPGEVPTERFITLRLPKSAGQDMNKSLALITAQNEGLSTKLWKVRSSHDDGPDQILSVDIDEQSMKTLTNQDNTLRYRFGTVRVVCANNAVSIVKTEPPS